MSGWLRAFTTWRNRRQRFAEEWAFHRDAAAAEWEALGLRPREARKQAARQLGGRYSYRRSALRAIGGDFCGLLELLPLRAWRKSALPLPLILLSVSLLSLAFDPFRSTALRCLQVIALRGPNLQLDRWIPATPAGLVPTQLAAWVLRIWMISGLARIAFHLPAKTSWRLSWYAVAVLIIMAFAGAVFWVVSLQFLTNRSWHHDGVQGLSLLVFGFAFLGLLYAGSRLWWADVKRRCPICLRLPGMPEQRGKPNDILVEPLEVESICFHGHGVFTENRWTRHFAPGAPLFRQ